MKQPPVTTFLIALALLQSPLWAQAHQDQHHPTCEALFVSPAPAIFSWQNHQWVLPIADMRSSQDPLIRLHSLGVKVISLLQETPLKNVYLVEKQGQKVIAKVYKSPSLEKLNQTLQRDYLMGEFLPLMNIETVRLQIDPQAVGWGVVFQDYHAHIASEIPEVRTQPFWGLMMKQIVALEINKDFRSWTQQMRQSYKGLEVDFRASNIAVELEPTGNWGHPVMIDW